MHGKKELYHWTVTFFEGTRDAVAYQAFNIWLTTLRKYKMLKNYLWVAERQDNGTVHFHIVIPHRIDVHRANSFMRNTFFGFLKKGMLPENIRGLHIGKYNGVHIAKHKKTGRVINFALQKNARSLGYYLSKYVTKNEGKFEHLAWHNSRGYSCLFTAVTFTIAEFVRAGHGAHLNRFKVFEMEFAKFIPWINGPPRLFTDHLYQLNSFVQTQLN